jgi:hypothetical protein
MLHHKLMKYYEWNYDSCKYYLTQINITIPFDHIYIIKRQKNKNSNKN